MIASINFAQETAYVRGKLYVYIITGYPPPRYMHGLTWSVVIFAELLRPTCPTWACSHLQY